jgi:predicted GNAT family N-acyltransferase
VIEVRPTRSADEVAAALALRIDVFVGEQGVERVADQDGLDPESIHLVAIEDERVLATCRLLEAPGVLKLGRMAVEPDHRRRGLGAALLAEAERVARDSGIRRIVLHAQVYAESLYAGAGYERVGDVFVEEGIEHVRMERTIA